MFLMFVKQIIFGGLCSLYKNIVNIAEEKQVFNVAHGIYITYIDSAINGLFTNILHKYFCLQ